MGQENRELESRIGSLTMTLEKELEFIQKFNEEKKKVQDNYQERMNIVLKQQKTENISGGDLRQEYDQLKKEYDQLRKEYRELSTKIPPLMFCCPTPNCQLMMFWVPKIDKEEYLTPFECPTCFKSYCFKCRSPAHPGEPCRKALWPLELSMKMKMCQSCHYFQRIESEECFNKFGTSCTLCSRFIRNS